MVENQYDSDSPSSILKFAERLAGKTLADFVEVSDELIRLANKGDFGLTIEKMYFGLEVNTRSEPDFVNAGVELKTTGVVIGPNGALKAKERLVLNLINYEGLILEEWENCSLLAKCKLMLILFYMYDKNVPRHLRIFNPKPILFEFPDSDLAQIRLDWETIRQKVVDGKAHELSESDTFYLAACRKGSGGPSEPLRTQPNSEIKAKSRAFSLKQSYVNQVIHMAQSSTEFAQDAEPIGIENRTENSVRQFEGLTVSEVAESFNDSKNGVNDKVFHRRLAMKMIDFKGKTSGELEKAGVEVKTIRVNSNWKPKESMSFPGFKYLEIVNQEWEDSSFFEKLERKFLFVVFRTRPDGIEYFESAFYWNMPYEDRLEAQRVWQETKRRVSIDASTLPSAKESPIAHVRPKARNGSDKIPTPQGSFLVKKCFWLNASYVASIIKARLDTGF